MANVRNANTFYVDSAAADTDPGTTGNLAVKNIRLVALTISATGGNSDLILKDVTTGATKLDVREATNGETDYYDFSNAPIVFPNGIAPTTVSNVVATLIIQETRG